MAFKQARRQKLVGFYRKAKRTTSKRLVRKHPDSDKTDIRRSKEASIRKLILTGSSEHREDSSINRKLHGSRKKKSNSLLKVRKKYKNSRI